MDINCDLGEGESLAKTSSLMRWITSANIACGGHAGDLLSIRRCLRLCREFGVRPGAHPGYFDREGFGRAEIPIAPEELELLLAQQIGAFLLAARAEKAPLTHVKLHGALYHAVEKSVPLARAYVAFVKAHLPGAQIYAVPGGHVASQAARLEVKALGEIFADRAYLSSGRLVPRSCDGAVVHGLAAIRRRMEVFRDSGWLPAQDGSALHLSAGTVCVHADSPDSPRIARALAEVFAR